MATVWNDNTLHTIDEILIFVVVLVVIEFVFSNIQLPEVSLPTSLELLSTPHTST